MEKEKIIEIKHLGKIYDNEGAKTEALRSVNFSIHHGEFVAIMGPSGSGKSTLLQILGLLDPATAGQYLLFGKNVDKLTDEEQASIRNNRMGFIFQSFNLLPKTTVLDNVILPLVYSGKPESDWESLALKAIDAVGLNHRLMHETSQLSGGEKQRVAIARALINSPEIIFADEPTGNLDSKSGAMVMKFIQDLNEKMGHTVILITHETYTAEHAERIIRIHDGEIISDAKVENRQRATGELKK
ncbi:MAG: ABC transporter ATP-binding protein [bacterium]